MTSVPIRQQILFHNGQERSYLLYVPSSYDASRPTPLLLVLHGGGGDASGMIRLTRGGFNDLADEHGFIVAYPDGIRRQWNDGRLFRRRSRADDVGFLSALIDELASQYTVHPKGVFVTGISNGGHMAYRMACEHCDQIAAIAPVAALMPRQPEQPCAPSLPVAVLMIMGRADPLVPYDGGEVRVGWLRRGVVLSAEESARFWADANHCTGEPVTMLLPDRQPDDGTRVRKTVYGGGQAPVMLYTIEGGGHTWPGGWQYLGVRMVGKTSRDLDACRLIWAFFRSVTKG